MDHLSPYIKEYLNVFTEDKLDFILKLRLATSEKDLIITKSNFEWKETFREVESKCALLIKDYNKHFFSLMPTDGLSLNHIGFLHDDLGSFTELHYDWEMINLNNDLIIKPLVVIVYLAVPEEGGDLFFPIQKHKIIPEKGKVVIFPSSFCFPHLSYPVIKGEKHLMRLTYRMENDYYKSRKIEL